MNMTQSYQIPTQPRLTREDVNSFQHVGYTKPKPKIIQKKALSSVWDAALYFKPYESIATIKALGIIPDVVCKRVKHCTESVYKGEWGPLGMDGIGEYKMPNNAVYSGEVSDNQFHGYGTLQDQSGATYTGEWNCDKLTVFAYAFRDGLIYEENNWSYLSLNDRRYLSSISRGFLPAPEERLTDTNPPRIVPPGHYDVGEGFYNPNIRCIVDATDLRKIIRIPSNEESKWIVENCRKAWDEPTGYRPDLYENWCSGRRKEERGFNATRAQSKRSYKQRIEKNLAKILQKLNTMDDALDQDSIYY